MLRCCVVIMGVVIMGEEYKEGMSEKLKAVKRMQESEDMENISLHFVTFLLHFRYIFRYIWRIFRVCNDLGREI